MTPTGATIWIVYLVSVLTSVGLAALLLRYRDRPVGRALLWYVLAGLLWSGVHLLNLAISGPRWSIVLFKLFYVVVALGPLTLVVFALAYTGRERYLRPKTYALLAVHPTLVTIFAFLNPGDVFFTHLGYDPGPGVGLTYSFGPAAAAHSLYSYVLVGASALLFVDLLRRKGSLYRVQTLLLVGGAVIPGTFTALTIATGATFDLTPVGIPIASGLFTVAIVRYHLMDLVPIARTQVLDSIDDAVFVVDTDGRILDVNPAGRRFTRLFGVDDESIVGRRLEAFVEETTLPERVTDSSADDEAIEVAVDGNHFSITTRPIERGRGRRIGWLLLVRNETERHRRESQLRRQNERLEQFASLVSHDLRNPLTVADGYLDMASETGDPEHFERVADAHDRMETIIQDVLTLARDGQAVTDPERISVADLAADAWDSVETGDATLEIREDAVVVADPDRATRLFENLFRNSLEHGIAHEEAIESVDGSADAASNPSGSSADLTVAVGVERGPQGLTIFVEDDGRGIPADEREQVLEEGYSTREEGTGLGLSIVTQIAEAHGWTVRVEEGADGGARFAFAGVEAA